MTVAVVLCIDVADFLPKRSSYFCVCVRLCVLVYPTRRDANIIILTFYTPRPSTNAWVSLCFERSVERDTLQYHPNTAEVMMVGIQFPKACSETIIIFFVQYFLQKISLYSCPRVATVKLSSTYHPDTVADTGTPGQVLFRYSCPSVSYMFYCARLHTCDMYTHIIFYTIPSSRLRVTVGVCPYDGNIFVLKYHKLYTF